MMNKLDSCLVAMALTFATIGLNFYIKGLHELAQAEQTNYLIFLYLVWKLLHDKNKD